MTDELAEKPVAWMYSDEQGGMVCTERREYLPAHGYTETPLYTRPAVDIGIPISGEHASARIMGDKDRENPVERPRPALEPSEDVVEALRELIGAIDKARNLVPDDEEGLAASIFCYHLNAAQDRARRVLWSIKDRG